jgi:MFS family permease
MIGLRWMFLAGLGIFTTSAVLCGLATSAAMLIVLAAVQAAGAAMVLCNTGAIVGAVFRGPGPWGSTSPASPWRR